ncbi:lipopolysaccharide export system permease protein [Chitinophaga skermanii]|uniref:Lipopolysaccharide export system permease protein n=1 Tax=Chitinophaga skermanii TaxID=331697 RepID=A0A327Q3T4_9BACT|nr:LptF/LptG family permease [Chitinophaga skermanii]RAI98401.1 lipopolysaccharide export system permease protein [Chitinophaga skermanii]
MKKIDWYILRKFIGTFVFCLMVLLVISVVIDITEKVDDFMKHNLSFTQIVMEYYIGFIPHIAALLFPLFIFISCILFTSKMAYRTEIVAILAAGVSFRRFLRPYWVGAIGFAFILWLANQYVVPAANRIRTTFENKYVHRPDDNLGQVSDKTYRIDTNTYVTLGYYNVASNYGSGFVLQRIKGEEVFFKMKAQSIRYDTATKKWALTGVSSRKIVGLKETLDERPDSLLKLPFEPSELATDDKNIQEALTTPELRRYIEREEIRGSEGLSVFKVEYYRRTSAAFSVIILTLIGGIMASKKVRGGSGLHLALGIVISASYILFLQFSTVFATKASLDPLLAVWIPNFVFGGLAFYLYQKAPK